MGDDPAPYDGPSGQTGPRGTNKPGSTKPAARPAVGGGVTPGGRGGAVAGPRGTTPGGRRRTRTGEAFNWQRWWWNNQFRFLDFEPDPKQSTGSADFFLGATDRKSALARASARTPVLLRERIVPALTEALGAKESEVRAAAVKALGRISEGVPLDLMTRLLDDSDRHVRFSAALALGDASARESLPRLLALVRDPKADGITRGFAAVSIGMIGEESSAGALREIALESKASRDLRACALVALGLIPCESTRETMRAIALDPKADADLRAIAAGALGKLCGDSETALALAGLASDKSPQVRRSAILALGLSDPAIAKIDETLANVVADDSDLPARSFACIALGERGTARARKPLLTALEGDPSPSLRSFAALGLGLLRDPSAAPYLREAFARPANGPSLRSAAALALGLLRDAGAGTALRATLADESADPTLRGFAALGIGLAGDRSAASAMESVLLSRPSVEVLEPLVRAIGLVGGDGTADVVLQAMEAADNDALRGHLIHAMGHLRDAKFVDPFLRILKSPSESEHERVYAAIALGHLGDLYATPRLAAITNRRNYLIDTPTIDLLTLLL